MTNEEKVKAYQKRAHELLVASGANKQKCPACGAKANVAYPLIICDYSLGITPKGSEKMQFLPVVWPLSVRAPVFITRKAYCESSKGRKRNEQNRIAHPFRHCRRNRRRGPTIARVSWHRPATPRKHRRPCLRFKRQAVHARAALMMKRRGGRSLKTPSLLPPVPLHYPAFRLWRVGGRFLDVRPGHVRRRLPGAAGAFLRRRSWSRCGMPHMTRRGRRKGRGRFPMTALDLPFSRRALSTR